MNNWSNEKMTATTIHEKMENGTFVVPKYQRGIVWKEQKKKDLIDTIKKGLPFGSILLYEDEKNKQYKLIDGLQRCTTVYEFISNPAVFFDENDIDDETIEKIADLTELESQRSTIQPLIVDIIIKWIKEAHETMSQVIGMQYYDCAKRLVDALPTLKGKETDLIELLKPMFGSYQNICQTMSATEIPLIIIHGNEDVLPVIFERINSKGSTLTKWQIYAATWSEEKIKINKELKDIVKYNRDRYESMVNDDELNIDSFDPTAMMSKLEINPFELVYGFGKLISEKYPHLFGNTKKIKEINSIGFNLINACLCFKNSEIKSLNTNLREVVGDDNNINLFLTKVLECIDIVDKILAVTRFKSNTRESQVPVHTEMQICSLIATVFINRYLTIQIDYEKDAINERHIHLESINGNWKQFKEQFKQNAIKVYLEDIIQIAWRGSGDKKLNSIILNPSYYTRNIDKNELLNVLTTWYEQIKIERNEYKKVQNPKETDKVILNVLYSKIFTAQEQLDDSVYDIEHLATKGLMKKRLERFDGALKLPLSSIGNICLLPEDYNREKGELTIYQYQKCLDHIQEIEDKYSFTEKEDLDWISDMSLSKEELEKEYISFIDKRFEIIKEKVIEVLFK